MGISSRAIQSLAKGAGMKRQRSPKHLEMIRQLPCVVCLDNISTEACHLRASSAEYGKVNPGVGQKPDDRWTTPLCGEDHREQHQMNELDFWGLHRINPFELALKLWDASGNYEEAERIVRDTAEGRLCHV